MSYGNPSMKSAIESLKAQHCDRILVFPLYPQYAASSTAAAFDSVWKTLLKMRNVPAIRSIRNYHDHPAYINALKLSVLEHWRVNGKLDFAKGEKLVMSFHGVAQSAFNQRRPVSLSMPQNRPLVGRGLGLEQR